MTSAAGLCLALICIAIVAAGLGLAAATWRPALRHVATVVLLAAGLVVGATGIVAAAVHQLAAVLP
ncbi:hypothetical protein [Streptomyces aureus]|uniref:hypothetical protein n=1 Tax=Streptomyces aureus TaxID=193461 RepID=UPI0005650960|nr:hypothetical protein [Streptomyces aureus]